MAWTHFHDMHSGGGQKLQWAHIFIEADEKEAREFFEAAFDRNPDHVTCNCCGNDYSVSSEESLEQITGYYRNCEYVYFDAEGNEVEREDVWIAGKGFEDGVTSKYVERQGFYEFGSKTSKPPYETVAQFELREDIAVFRRTKELNGARLELTEGAA
jgi:hypothetical protein